ncbi:MAG: dethiobiotin synthase [Nitrospirae bacterium]|nr:dethiobiotin synthase [Nitrospirota bacterium]
MSERSPTKHLEAIQWHNASCFVTGTDTGVGKTMITGALALAIQARNHTVGIMKPVETGLHVLTDPQESDGARLSQLSSHQELMELTAPYQFQSAIAPLAASRQENTPIVVSRIVTAHTHLLQRNDYVMVEGVGGAMVPLTVDSDVRDLIRTLRCPCIIVGHAFLGTINHTLLTVQALQELNIPILAIILNIPSPPQEHQASLQHRVSTTDILRERTSIPVLGPIECMKSVEIKRKDFFQELSQSAWIIQLSDLLEKRMQETES